MIFYFAYGSNMSINRMIDRCVKFNQVIPAKLENYELRFNKVSKKQGAVANVMYKEGSIVEGVLYEVDSLEDLYILDKYEGVSSGHYDRIILRINNFDAWVYVAKQEHIQEGLKPQKEYLNHLLEGKQFLSKEYFEKLERII